MGHALINIFFKYLYYIRLKQERGIRATGNTIQGYFRWILGTCEIADKLGMQNGWLERMWLILSTNRWRWIEKDSFPPTSKTSVQQTATPDHHGQVFGTRQHWKTNGHWTRKCRPKQETRQGWSNVHRQSRATREQYVQIIMFGGLIISWALSTMP